MKTQAVDLPLTCTGALDDLKILTTNFWLVISLLTGIVLDPLNSSVFLKLG